MLVLAACGGDDDAGGAVTTGGSSTPAAGSGPIASEAGVDFNDADVEFAQGMIAHHEQAIEMSEIAQDPVRAASAEVTSLAARIEAAQDPEIDAMTGWLEAWGAPLQMDSSDGHDMSEMTGMMSVEDMEALNTTTGAEFDDMWLTMMIEHHEGAIEMATAIDDEGASPDVRTLSAAIVAAQQAEIDEMRELLDG